MKRELYTLLPGKIVNASDEVPICDDHDYTQFDEEYYGYRCPKCRVFYPYGCEPWIEPSEPDDNYDWDEES